VDGVKLGLLGGTFDPVHLGHLILAECAREQFELSEVRFLVAGDPWRKWDTRVSPAEDRVAMVRLAVSGNRSFVVAASEVERSGATYTVDTLRALRRRLAPADEIYFLLGQDALADMPLWREPAEIAALAHLAVAPREGGLKGGEPATEERKLRLKTLTVDMPPVGISSTDLRSRVRSGKSIRYLVPAEVEAYIRDKGLYQD
jgi:nicotinate-nucleotide adenylyltransferase